MSRAARRYQSHIHSQLERIATWLPGDRLDLGDVGTFSSGGFRKETSLAELGIEFERESAGTRPTLSCSASTKLSLGESVEATAKKVASGRAKISLERSGGVVFEAQDVDHVRIANPATVSEAVVALHKQDGWKKAWVLVDQVWHVGLGTVIVAVSDNVDASFSVEVGKQLGLAAFARSAAELGFVVHSGEVVSEIGTKDFTPLYTARKLGFWKDEMKPVRSTDDSEALARASIDDVLDSWDVS